MLLYFVNLLFIWSLVVIIIIESSSVGVKIVRNENVERKIDKDEDGKSSETKQLRETEKYERKEENDCINNNGNSFVWISTSNII